MPRVPVPANVDEFLKGPRHAVVATVGADGAPYTAVTWYGWTREGTVLLNMDASRRRLRHLRADPRVSLTVLTEDDWYSYVALFGEVREIRPDLDLADIDEMSQRYLGRPYPHRDRTSWTAEVAVRSWHAWGALRPG
ncbi:PPOX class F420-dependent oxidoreductase [Pseudonocardia ailaonensis]|uniref:PPOX class F420-dependent oxidoreductase n=1 Tax=Pseudonocardia ailaonensis TaxID=367279 RepID=A0ABN2NMI0_9PSEU